MPSSHLILKLMVLPIQILALDLIALGNQLDSRIG
ncbi:hypothetical protein BvCmsKSNP093_04196 [Escherichia coli]|nr:hypothetical protein BvCmsKSNP093_04196 [Escherichia coli]